MGMAEFSSPENRLGLTLAGMAGGESGGDLTDLPMAEPLQDPLPAEEQPATVRQQPRQNGRPAAAQPVQTPRYPEPDLLAGLQRDQIDMVHTIEHMRNDITSARRAVIVLAIGVAVGAALMLLLTYRAAQTGVMFTTGEE